MTKSNNLIKKILKEARQRGTLYHYTKYFSLLEILKTNTLKSGNVRLPNGKIIFGISTTRNKNFHDKEREIGGISIRIDLNGDKISENYKIRPYNDFNDSSARTISSESEELISTGADGLVNLEKYIENIVIFPDKEKAIPKRTFEIIDILRQKEIPFEYDDIWDDLIDEYKEEIDNEEEG